jgi:hypothetical protein
VLHPGQPARDRRRRRARGDHAAGDAGDHRERQDARRRGLHDHVFDAAAGRRGANLGGAQPDTTYARRCLSGQFAGAIVAGAIIEVDVDQVGVGTVGADLRVSIRVKQPARPFETFLAYNEIR